MSDNKQIEGRPTPLEIINNMRDKNFREEIILEEVEKELIRESTYVKGLERDRNDWKQKYMSCEADLTIQEKENETLEKEVERLNGLIKLAFNEFYMKPFPHNEPTFEQFKVKHGL